MKKSTAYNVVTIAIILLTVLYYHVSINNLEDQLHEQKVELRETKSLASGTHSYMQGYTSGIGETIYHMKKERENQQKTIDILEARLKALETNYYVDPVITVVLNYDYDELDTFTSITFDEDGDNQRSFLDLVEENFTVTYDDRDDGKSFTEIERLREIDGSKLYLYKNGEIIDNIETISYSNGDVFEFKVEWDNHTDRRVDTAINLFIENFGNQYVSSEAIDYHVASAFAHLGILDEYITLEEVIALYKDLESTSGKELFKAITLVSAVGGDPTDVDGNDLVQQLLDAEPTGAYGTTAFGSIGLNAYEHSKDASAYEAAIISDLTTTNNPMNVDVDSAGLTLVALSEYDENKTVEFIIDESITYLSIHKQSDTGGITMTDLWSNPDHPKEVENCTSTAQVIIGLVANGTNPTGEYFTKKESIRTNNLITRLLDYQLEDGSFKYKIEDESSDQLFTTPQAFAALVAYQEFRNGNKSTFNLYDFNE